jgi:hypothetical protein
MLIPIIPILLFLGVLLAFAWWMDKSGKVRVAHQHGNGRRAVSVVIAALVTVVVFRLAFPMSAISGGGLLIAAAIAYAAGIAAAYFVRPAAKDDLWLWLILFGVTAVSTYAALKSAIALLGSEEVVK